MVNFLKVVNLAVSLAACCQTGCWSYRMVTLVTMRQGAADCGLYGFRERAFGCLFRAMEFYGILRHFRTRKTYRKFVKPASNTLQGILLDFWNEE